MVIETSKLSSHIMIPDEKFIIKVKEAQTGKTHFQ